MSPQPRRKSLLLRRIGQGPPAKKMPPAKEGRPGSPSSKCPPAKKKKPPAKEGRPKIEVGDHVCVHKSFMGGRHLPCRIVWEHGNGRFLLYCAKGILKTTFCLTELVPLSRKLVISLTNWRNAPQVSLRSAADETTLVECSNCSALIALCCLQHPRGKMRHQNCE